MELVNCLLMGNTASALGVINRAAWDGVDLRQLHRQMLQLLRGVLVQQWGAADSLDLPLEVKDELARLAVRVPASKLAKTVRLFTEVDLQHDAPSPLALELAVVEACLDGHESSPVRPESPSRPASAVTDPGPASSVEDVQVAATASTWVDEVPEAESPPPAST